MDTVARDDAGPPGWEQPEPGDCVGRYVLESVLGSGGMGTVFAAHDPELHRRVAIKLLHPLQLGATSSVRLIREGQALARLTHDNVVAVYGLGYHGSSVYIAMELVDGETLAQWLQTPRTWQAVVDVFIDAARGLAAVHAEGIIHRDFKPGNVCIARDGTVKVLDFGLARALGERSGSAGAAATAGEPAPASETNLLHTQLTGAGAVVGTPAYMAAEQFQGAAVDHRADQHAFFVSLYEALYGVRPFSGSGWRQLRAAVLAGALAPPPKRDVPRALSAMIRRGTSPDPARRFPDMNAVIDRLSALRGHRPRRVGAWVLGVAGLSSLGWLVGTDGGEASSCARVDAALATAWGDPQREAVRAALGDDPAAAGVLADLDTYAEDWAAQRTEACAEPGRDTALDLRLACLDARLDRLAAAAEVLAEPSPTLASRARRVSESLPSLATCRDVPALRAAVAPPEDPITAARVAELRHELSRLTALRSVGRTTAAEARVPALEEAVRATGYAPLLAELEVVRGGIDWDAGRTEEAIEHYEAAFTTADAAGHDRVAAEAGIDLVYMYGDGLHDLPRAQTWARHAEGSLERFESDGGDGVTLRARLHLGLAVSLQRTHALAEALAELESAEELAARGDSETLRLQIAMEGALMQAAAGRHALARAGFEDVLARQAEHLGPDHPELASIRSYLAISLWKLGEHDAAIEQLKTAIDRLSEAYSPEHVNVGANLINLGMVLDSAGRLDESAEALRRGTAIIEAGAGADSPMLAIPLGALAGVERHRGHPEQARQLYARAIELVRATDSPQTLVMLMAEQAELRVRLGEVDPALTELDEALAVGLDRLGPDDLGVAAVRSVRAGALSAAGRHDEAIAALKELVASYERRGDADEIDGVRARVALAEAEVAAGRADEGLARAQAIVDALGTDAPPSLVAGARFVLAKAERAAGRGDAEATAREVAALLGPGGLPDAELSADVDAFLADG